MPKGWICPVCKGGAFHRVRKNKSNTQKAVSVKCKDCGATSAIMVLPVEENAKHAIGALMQEWEARVRSAVCSYGERRGEDK